MYNIQAKKKQVLPLSPVCGNLHQEEEILPGAGTKPVGAASG